MMKLSTVQDLSFESVMAGHYDLVFAASGFESRCTGALHSLDRHRFERVAVFGFEEHANHPNRLRADKEYEERWGASPVVAKGASDQHLLQVLSTLRVRDGVLRVLVDY